MRRLVLAGLAERWGDAFDPARNRDLNDLMANYVDRGDEIVVVALGARIVATGTLRREDDAAGSIVRMSVAASHRRKGLGRLVVEELIRRARRAQLREVRVNTDTPWASAVALYRACGFTEVGSDVVETRFVKRL